MSNLLDEESQEEVSSDKKREFTEIFQDERETWTKLVKEIASRFKGVEILAEVQVDLYSRRQQAIEHQFKLIAIHNRLKKAYSVEYKAAFEKAGVNEDARYSEKEKIKFAEAATSATKFKIDTVSSQIEFFRETVKTIDNMIFGVKHRIEIENFKIGMK